MSSYSLKLWFNDLTWMKQGVLMSCIRNCDSVISEGPYKILARGVRSCCIKSAQTKGSFNARRPNPEKLLKASVDLVEDYLDNLPIHFVAHLMHASEVIGYCHPDVNIAETWSKIYKMIVHELHLNVEHYIDFNNRLADDAEQVARENEYDQKCYETKNYGDNIGIVNE